MPNQELQDRVRNLLVEELGVDENEVIPSAQLIDDLGADSLDQVELVMQIEEAFGVEIPDEDIDGLRTVKDVYDYVETRVAAK